MIPNILMIVGALTWLAGELYGVHRNAVIKNPGNDTTSQWVWLLEAKFPIVKVLVVTFFVSLIGHFLWHSYLLP